jgi:X-Pro dipeptidyl-peptidase (S15 family)
LSLLSWAVARATKLEKPLSRKLRIERDLRVPMADGVELLADRYAPEEGDGLPVVLIRTPYGRGGKDCRLYGEIFAQRGYQVVVQSCRGTFGSGGTWQPFQTDVEDGVATVEWLRQQSWFGGTIGMFGPSYLGFSRNRRRSDQLDPDGARERQAQPAHYALHAGLAAHRGYADLPHSPKPQPPTGSSKPATSPREGRLGHLTPRHKLVPFTCNPPRSTLQGLSRRRCSSGIGRAGRGGRGVHRR